MNTDANKQTARVGTLIDADTISASHWPMISKSAERFGRLVVMRCFGDFSNGRNGDWVEVCKEGGHQAVMVPGQDHARNGSSIQLTIEATELLVGERLDVMCVVSSDSDFSPLARRITASGVYSVGMGRSIAPESLQASFEQFIDLDVKSGAPFQDRRKQPDQRKLFGLIAKLTGDDHSASVSLTQVGKELRERHPDLADKFSGGRLLRTLRGMNVFEESGEGRSRRVKVSEERRRRGPLR